jgi:tetratricopeptide (TPR) repeat protein
MAGLFISYRRTDGGGWAGRLNDHLSLRFGSNLVWQDVDDLKVGKDYLPQILKKIKSSDAILIVIGPHWLKDGQQRLKNPKDVLRQEILQSLKSKAAVIPTLVGGASMPPANKLPLAIRRLIDRDGVALRDEDWARSMQFLFERLQDIVRSGGATEPLPDVHDALETMQMQYIAAMIPEPRRALDISSQALKLLDAQMPSYPHDHYLQMFRGYFLKNQAMSLRDLGDLQGFNDSLREADRTFQTIRTEAELYLSNAYNGLGSVTLLQGDAKQAIQWIDRALALVPNHPFALHDRQEALRFYKQQAVKK